MHYDCLIIDDETEVAAGVCEYFNLFDVNTAYVESAEAALAFLQQNSVNLILLDINLPKDSGFTLCQKLRQTLDLPILFISARTSNDDMLLALNIGGDDYIQKPFTLSVLLAKVKAVLKRYGDKSTTSSRFRIDAQAKRIYLDETMLDLRHMEYKLLKYLLENSGRVISKDELFEKVWADSYIGDGTLNVHIRALRKKIETNPQEPEMIKTVWGLGYIFEEVG